jgi:hypothetical protein
MRSGSFLDSISFAVAAVAVITRMKTWLLAIPLPLEVSSDGTTSPAEVHWYESHGIGRKEFKIKRLLGSKPLTGEVIAARPRIREIGVDGNEPAKTRRAWTIRQG